MTRITRWIANAVVACCLAAGFAQAASAQTMWSFKGFQFPARDGWCSKETNQGTPSEPAPTLEARPCGADFPYVSIGLGRAGDGSGPVDTSPLASNGVDYSNGPDGHKLVLGMINAKHTACVETKYTVTRDAIPLITGFLLDAEYKCTDTTEAVTFRNWTSFASTRKGDLWIVAFDYPQTAVTGGDIAMLQSVIATIQAH